MEDLTYIAVPEPLASIREETTELQFAMASEPLVGSLLRTLAASKPAGRFLELGTGTGIATAWLLAGMDAASTLVSVDTDATLQQVARRALGHDDRLTLVTVDGTQYLQQHVPAFFDLVFADAMPGKYESLEQALAIVKPGGFYVIDDMLPQANWPEGHAAKVPLLLEQIALHPEFEMTPMIWASGVAVAVRRPEPELAAGALHHEAVNSRAIVAIGTKRRSGCVGSATKSYLR